MYSTRTKIADIITVWSDINGHGATSTTAALIASRLAVGEKKQKDKRKVLMLSTDPGPGDGVQILSPVVGNIRTMDNLILLATAGGLNSIDDFEAFVIKVDDNLDVMRSTNDFSRISSEPIAAYRKILDFAATIYDFIIIDAAGELNPLVTMLLKKSDLVVLCASQNVKHIERFIEDNITTSLPVLEDKNCAVVVTRYSPLPYLDAKKVCKMIDCDDVFTLSEDVSIHKSGSLCSLHGFIVDLYGGDEGLFGKFSKRKARDSATADELDSIASVIYDLHTASPKEGENE